MENEMKELADQLPGCRLQTLHVTLATIQALGAAGNGSELAQSYPIYEITIMTTSVDWDCLIKRQSSKRSVHL